MLKSSPNWKIGSASRDDELRVKRRTCNFPPPDSYNPMYQTTKEKLPTWAFGTGQRTSMATVKQTPGPNVYNLASRAIEGRKYNMGLNLDNQSSIGCHISKTKFVPGAGTYNPDYSANKKLAARYSMKARHQDLSKLQVPGPGTYQTPATQIAPNKRRGATYKFVSSVRSGMPKTLGPGPGGYNIPCMITHMPGHTNARSKSHAYILKGESN